MIRYFSLQDRSQQSFAQEPLYASSNYAHLLCSQCLTTHLLELSICHDYVVSNYQHD